MEKIFLGILLGFWLFIHQKMVLFWEIMNCLRSLNNFSQDYVSGKNFYYAGEPVLEFCWNLKHDFHFQKIRFDSSLMKL